MAQLRPISFDASALTQLRSAVAKQSESTGYEPSNDPTNFPVWRTPDSGKFVVYVPNHFTLNPATDERELNEDLVLLHRVKDGSKYGSEYRCIRDIILPDHGLDGNCPLCDGAQDSGAWYEAKLQFLARQNGTSVEALASSEESAVKALRQSLLDEKKVGYASNRTPRHVFVVVIAPINEANQINLDEARPYWFDLSTTQYNKFVKAVESTLSADKCIAGHAFLVDYNYSHDGKPNSRDAARNMAVAIQDTNEGINSRKAGWDTLTADWTPIKAMEMVKRCAFYPKDALAEKVAPILAQQEVDRQNTLAAISSAPAVPAAPAHQTTPTSAIEPAPLPAAVPIGADLSDANEVISAEVVEPVKPSANDVNALMGGGFASA